MVVWFDCGPDLAHYAILVDQEGGAVDTHVFLAVHALLAVSTVELRNGCVSIGK